MLKPVKRLMKILCSVIVLLLILGGISYYKFSQEASVGVPVLNYHQINDEGKTPLTVPVYEFESEMDYLEENGYHTITPEQLADYLNNGAALPSKPILITFDDGYKDNYINAFPILKKHNMVATVFIITDFVGTYVNYLTWDQIREMSDYGICMGSHTLSHFELVPLSPEDAMFQLTQSKKALEYWTQKKVTAVAYPCGTFNEEIENMAKEAGYTTGYTVHYGLAKPGDNPMGLDRIPIFGGFADTFVHFKTRLTQAPFWGRIEHVRKYVRNNYSPWLSNFIYTP